MSPSRPPHPRLAAALGAAGAALLLLAGTSACQMADRARAGGGVSDAVDELLAWEAVTLEADVDASADQVYDYLLHTAAAGNGTAEPSRDDARRLAELELTTAIGAPDGRTAMRDLEPYSTLYSALVLSFGGNDVTGLKDVDGTRYARVDVAALVRDALHGDEAAVAEAERFVREAGRLPASLAVPGTALAGGWVEVDPYRYDEYAAALVEGDPRVEPEVAEAFAGALGAGGDLLTSDALWGFVAGLESAARGDDTALEPAGEERGAELLRAELPAGDAWHALEPLLRLLTEQSARFGLPPLVERPAREAAQEPVTARLAVRNGVLSQITFDLAQFAPGGADAAGGVRLPLTLDLTGGSALSLSGPSGGPLQPEDLGVALTYLADRTAERAEDPERADLPGPMQPGA